MGRICPIGPIRPLGQTGQMGSNGTYRFVAASKFYGQAKGLISTGQLSTLLHLHFQPINLVVYQESHCQD